MLVAASSAPSRRAFEVTNRSGIPLRVWEVRPDTDEDAPLVLIATAPGASEDAWRPFARRAGRGWRIASWEYRGLYDETPSSQPPPSTRDHGDDLIDVVRALDARRVVLITWALGTVVGLEALSRAPSLARALVAINGVPGRPFSRMRRLSATGLRRVQEQLPFHGAIVRRGAEQLRRFPRVLDAAGRVGLVAPHIDREAFLCMADGFARLDPRRYARFVEAIARTDHTETLRHLSCPSLFLAGQRDPLIPAAFSERMAQLAPDARLELLPTGSHYVPVEFAEFLELCVEDFLYRRAGFPWLPPHPASP
jgi:pimeloyl-ACP methyl ester carboxylesterase